MNNIIENIKCKIHTIRGKQVMLDRDLARLYDVETRRLNEQVRRNKERFPEDFMFQLEENEYNQFDLDNTAPSLKSQIATSRWGGIRKLPYAFTEQGVAALSGVLRSKKAIYVNINIMRAFVAMRHFLLENAQVFHRLDNVERKQIEYQIKTDDNFDKVFKAIEERHITPKQRIFYDGQVFDAFKFASDLVKSAKKEIILIDNYIDESVLALLSSKMKEVSAIIYTANISESLNLAKEKFNRQYGCLDIKEFGLSHDRFLIIDNKDIYHIGASIKDLGKKWFCFSKIDAKSLPMLERLNENKRNAFLHQALDQNQRKRPRKLR